MAFVPLSVIKSFNIVSIVSEVQVHRCQPSPELSVGFGGSVQSCPDSAIYLKCPGFFKVAAPDLSGIMKSKEAQQYWNYGLRA